MPVSESTYQRLVMEDPEHHWELHDGLLREKQPTTFEHGDLTLELAYQLRHQLNRSEFRVHANHARLRRSNARVYIPDIVVIPISFAEPLHGRSDLLDLYADPMPLVVEIWSPSTGGLDVSDKLPEYQARGDLEIWFLHPYDKTLTARRRQPDGSHDVSNYRRGTVQPVALPNVTIDLEALFAFP